MYIDIVPNRNSPPAILLRESRREGGKILKRTIANLAGWPMEKVELFRRLLRDEKLVSPDELFTVERSLPHGHVEAVLGTIRKLGLDELLEARRCRQRDLMVALLVERLIAPGSKLAATLHWSNTTLAEELDLGEVDVNEVYEAMDWLLERKARIEKKLAKRHLREADQVLFDVSSSYYYGRMSQLAQFGHDRDGKQGCKIIVYGLMTNREGCPVALDVYAGNTADPETIPDQMEKMRTQFGLERVILVGDRGMLPGTRLEQLRQLPHLGWITALRSSSIRQLVQSGSLQMSLFDQQNLAEIESSAYPGERLIACYNPLLAEERRRKREDLLLATEKQLDKIVQTVSRRTLTPLTQSEIALKVGKVIQRYKVGKHYRLTITDGQFAWERDQANIEQEAALDGIYVLRTSVAASVLEPDNVVRSYKGLARVETAFRNLKSCDLQVRPIRHWNDDHIQAHIFLCMLAYYVEWHMQQALAPLLFHDEELEAQRPQRDPVAPAKPSASVSQKKAVRKTANGLPISSFHGLLQDLGTRCRSRCKMANSLANESFQRVTEATPRQKEAFRLLGLYPV
jgi:transposase